MNYSKLFEPGKIGKLTLKNRFIVGAMVVGSGPAGLYAAYVAAKRGHKVTEEAAAVAFRL